MGWEGTADEEFVNRRGAIGRLVCGCTAAGGVLWAAGCSECASAVADEVSDGTDAKDWIWLGSRVLRAGLLQSSGGALAWLGPAGSDRNLINNYDRGRLVQQSWYGSDDGSNWNGRPWRWNPVQGGDWRGRSARICSRRVSESSAFIRTEPVHWAAGNPVTDAVMEQTINLRGEFLEIRFRFEYLGRVSHPARHQELPAVFVAPELRNLVTVEAGAPWEGTEPRRSCPGWPNEYRELVEPWAAWVDDSDWGLGCCVPRTRQLTCYRVPGDGAGRGGCSYFAPIETLAVVPGFRFEWDVWLTVGSVTEIRERFRRRLVG
jgi:hypothetical protein